MATPEECRPGAWGVACKSASWMRDSWLVQVMGVTAAASSVSPALMRATLFRRATRRRSAYAPQLANRTFSRIQHSASGLINLSGQQSHFINRFYEVLPAVISAGPAATQAPLHAGNAGHRLVRVGRITAISKPSAQAHPPTISKVGTAANSSQASQYLATPNPIRNPVNEPELAKWRRVRSQPEWH